MVYKFERLEVWKLALKHVDLAYSIAEQLPNKEKFNLTEQMRRSAVSVSLNIAEGSIGQSNAEQSRFLTIAIRSLLETIAIVRIIEHRKYRIDEQKVMELNRMAKNLFIKLQAFKNSLS